MKTGIKGAFLSILLFVMIFAVACGSGDDSMTDMELFEEAVRANLDRTSYSYEGEVSLRIEDLQLEDPDAAMMFGMFQQLGMTMKGAMDQRDPEDLRFHLDGQLNAMGMGIAMEIYVADNLMVLRAPMMTQFFQDPRLMNGYVIMDLDQMEEDPHEMQMGAAFNEDDVLALFNYFGEITLSIMEEDFIENRGEQTVSIDGVDTKATELVITIGEEEFERIWRAIPEVLQDEELRGLLGNLLDEEHQGEMERELDEFLEMVDDEAMEEALEAIKEAVDFENSEIRFTLFIDDEYRIIMEKGEFTLAVRDGGESAVIHFGMTMSYWNINQDVDIQLPELTEENSIHLEELIESMFQFPGL